MVQPTACPPNMNLDFLPGFNAILNALATVLLVAGYLFVRRRRIDSHRRCMLGAFGISILFLVCYVAHKIWRAASDGGMHTPFHGKGVWQAIYLVILLTHLVLAMAVPFLAVRIILLARAGRIDRHRRLARITLPVWLYVSLTGVVIYLMLYHWNPDPTPMTPVTRTP